MSKELIISASRHETRVAVVEDDQVAEVFYQRENEYSLAGSIHKGRVTRVLPGMQSAFVDIGLERDAFLYVSDFFEDNDEYDKIVTSVEEKVFKLDRTPAAQVAAAPVVVNEPQPVSVPEAAADTGPVAAAPVAPSANGNVASAPGQDPRRDDRDRRGRRSRRRRGGQKGGGRGLPDAKFYSPRNDGESQTEEPEADVEAAVAVDQPAQPVRAAAPAEADDFFVLPGESLAKYRHPGSEDEEPEQLAGEAPDEPETAADLVMEADLAADDLGAELSDAVAAAEAEIEAPAEVAVEEAHSELSAAPAAVAEETEEVLTPVEAAPEEAAVDTPVEAVAAAPEIETAEDVDLPSYDAAEPETADTESEPEEADEPAESIAMEAAAEAAEASEPEPGNEAEGETVVEPEGPEPARIPTSLTATLREQNPRYLHRVSRRTRRKGRDGQPRDGRDGQGREGQGRDGQVREGQPRDNQTRDVRGPAPTAEAPPPRPQHHERERSQQEPRSSDRPAVPSISDLLKEGQEIIVQIAKEPLGQKGARITSHIALPGRFLVYMPTVDHIGVSRKIPSEEERTRLKRVLQAHRTGIPGGYIVRTAGDGRTEEELRADMMFLYNMWLDMRQKAERRPAPLLIHHDLNVVERILRDQLTSNFKSIWVDNEEVYESTLRFVQRFQPSLVGRVKMYTRSTPIFDEFSVTSEIEKALRPKVWLKSGGYIVINQTEALVAIDVNTGKFVGKSNRLEDTIVKTNTDAIKEIVRQIRLRDLGGIIVIDFIDMDERKNRQKVMQTLEETMRADRAPYKILQFNDFGLVAITRKRVKQSLERTLCAPCSYCEGAGFLKSPQTVVGEILQEAHKIARAVEGKDVLLRVNPEVAKLLKSNQNTYLQEMEEVLGGRTVIVKSDPQLHPEKFDLA